MNRKLILIGTTVAVVLAFVAGVVAFNSHSNREAAQVARANNDALVRPHAPVFGNPAAKVTIVEFFDPSCEACRAYHPVVQEIRRQFPTQVRVVLRYTVFHEGSDEAVRILEAARMQDKFEPVLDALLEQQPGWAVHGAPQMDVAWEIAGAAGLDLERAESDKLFPGITGILNQDARTTVIRPRIP